MILLLGNRGRWLWRGSNPKPDEGIPAGLRAPFVVGNYRLLNYMGDLILWIGEASWSGSNWDLLSTMGVEARINYWHAARLNEASRHVASKGLHAI